MTAARLTLKQDGDVEFAHEGGAQLLGDASDGLGNLLRFRLHG